MRFRDLRLVIFDDAHLAEQPFSGLQILRIPAKPGPWRVLYRTICDLVVAHTDAYAGLRAMRDGTAGPGTPPELLSFGDWAAIATASRDAIEASPLVAAAPLKDETDKVKAEVKKLRDEIKWVWPKVREHVTHCGVLIGPSGIEIRPCHLPTALNAGYSQAKQRMAWMALANARAVTITPSWDASSSSSNTMRSSLLWPEKCTTWGAEPGDPVEQVGGCCCRAHV